MQRPSLAFVVVTTLLAAVACARDAGLTVRRTIRNQGIVGGVQTTIAEHPWQVSLQYAGFADAHFCGGSIIDAGWVLTANHCVEGETASGIRVVAGVTRLSAGGAQDSGVVAIFRNPGFSSPENGHDVALLQLAQPFTLGGDVQTIGLVTPADVTAGLTDTGVVANVSGWGALDSQTQQSPDQLRAVDVPIRSMNEASQFYGQLSQDQLAAGGDGVDSCQGDSGGPLTVPAGSGDKLAGVVSWGSGCGDGAPGMYARVSAFIDWINSTMANPSDVPTSEVPAGWMCPDSYVGDGECDCGCGALDPDCPDTSIGSCQFNDCDEWQQQQGLQLDSADPTQCSGGTGPDTGCPTNSSPTPDGTACECNSGFVPNADLTACVPDDSGIDCPAHASPNADDTDCVCDPGYHSFGDGCQADAAEGEGEGDGTAQTANDDPSADGGCNGTGSTPPVLALLLALPVVARRRTRR